MPEQSKTPLKFRYEERADISETFADSIGTWYFDGNTLRIDFLVSRFDEKKSSQSQTGRRVPSCRLVLTTNAAIELLNRCQRLGEALKQAGIVHKKEESSKD